MLSVKDKKENIYSIIKGRQIILCKKQYEIKVPQFNWVPCELSASSMSLSHRDWLPFLMQRPYNHKLTFRLSKEGSELKKDMLNSCSFSTSNEVEDMNCFCLVKDIQIWNDPKLWEELYKAKEFNLWDVFPFNAEDKYQRHLELQNLKTQIKHISAHLKNEHLTEWDEKIIDDVGDGDIERYLNYWIEFYGEHGAGPEKKFFNYNYIRDITKIPICYLRFFRVKNADSDGDDVVKNFNERFNRIKLMVDKSWNRLDEYINDIKYRYKITQPRNTSEKLALPENGFYVNYKDIIKRTNRF